MKRLEDAGRDLVAALERYGARAARFDERDGIMFSEPMECSTPSSPGSGCRCHCCMDLGPALYSNRVIFGREALEIRGAGGRASPACSGSRNIRPPPGPGLLDACFQRPFAFVVTQSFTFLSKADAER